MALWQLRNLNDAYKQRPPTRYVVDKFFTRGSLNIVYGPPAGMKSMTLADMCACVVSGMDWLPNAYGNGEGVPVEQGAVLWVDMDNGTQRTDERVDAVSRGRKIPADAPFHYISMPVPPLQLHPGYRYPYIDDDGEQRELTIIELLMGLIDTIRELDAAVVVIDNLGLITGDVEENGAEMAGVMGNLRLVAERTDAAIIVVHHQRKGGSNGSRAGDALRGHSSIEAAVDLAIQIVRENGQPEITIRSTKTRGVDVPQLTARFNYTHRDGTHDLETAWFEGVPGVRGENAIRDAIFEMLRMSEAMTKTKLAQDVAAHLTDTGINRVRAWIDELLAIGELVEEAGQYNRKLIKLP